MIVCSAWATTADVCTPCSDYDFDQSLLTEGLEVASDVLFELSGRRWPGSCTATVRPCKRALADGPPLVGTAGEYMLGGGYPYMASWGVCGGTKPGRDCGCSAVHEIELSGHKVTSVTQVKVDGDVLDPSLYRIDDYRYLVRLPDADGDRPGWPSCQDLLLPTTEDGTFSVTFAYGEAPPASGVRAAAELGCQLALACRPETQGECKLPQRIQSITRQGVSMTFLDPQTFLQERRTGLYAVDLFLATYNPHRIQSRTSVISPDVPKRWRRAGT